MADAPVSPVKAQESATTREEMDFEDVEHEQETGRVSPLGTETHTPPTIKSPSRKRRVSFQEGHQEIPPQKPPRPLSPQQQAENTLVEAFPSIDAKVVKAVLHASNGRVEPAFNALLGMSDPDFKEDEPPPQPPRPAQRQPHTQLEADELYARQLAEQYNSSGPRGQSQYNQREPTRRGPNQQRPHYDDDDDDDRERSFLDDDLPEIGKTIQQGFMDTQKRVNSWINNFRKKIDGEDDVEDLYASSRPGPRQGTGAWRGRQNFGASQSEQLHGIRKSAEAPRRSTEAQRYDADPHELGEDEFERLELRDEEATASPPPMPPRTSSRKSANPGLFKSQPKPPQSGPVDEVDAADRQTSASGQDPGKARKWQPLTSVGPHPHAEEDNDPFSLGDDEEETAGKDKVEDKGEEVRKQDTERLKEKARESVSVGGGEERPKKGLEESGRKGSIDAEAAELLGGGGRKG